MSPGQEEYQAVQEQVRRLYQDVGRIAAELVTEAESARTLAEGAAAIGDRRMLTFDPVLDAAQERLSTATTRPISELIEKLQELEAVQASAAERYEKLSAEERVGQIPASNAPREMSHERSA
jgi:hypothetical protein